MRRYRIVCFGRMPKSSLRAFTGPRAESEYPQHDDVQHRNEAEKRPQTRKPSPFNDFPCWNDISNGKSEEDKE